MGYASEPFLQAAPTATAVLLGHLTLRFLLQLRVEFLCPLVEMVYLLGAVTYYNCLCRTCPSQ